MICSNAGGLSIEPHAAPFTPAVIMAGGHESRPYAKHAATSLAPAKCCGISPAVQRGSNPLPIFATLQALDLATTLAAFHYGGYEANAITASILPILGPVAGLVAAKVLLVLIATMAVSAGKRRPVRIANFAYLGVVAWNLQIVVRLVLQ
jgi:hypothetical protein